MVYEGVGVRSTEVDRGRPKSRVFGACFGRPDGFGSSDFDRIEICLCPIDLYGFREPILLKSWICWPRKGRNSSIFNRKESAEISMFSPQQNEGICAQHMLLASHA